MIKSIKTLGVALALPIVLVACGDDTTDVAPDQNTEPDVAEVETETEAEVEKPGARDITKATEDLDIETVAPATFDYGLPTEEEAIETAQMFMTDAMLDPDALSIDRMEIMPDTDDLKYVSGEMMYDGEPYGYKAVIMYDYDADVHSEGEAGVYFTGFEIDGRHIELPPVPKEY